MPWNPRIPPNLSPRRVAERWLRSRFRVPAERSESRDPGAKGAARAVHVTPGSRFGARASALAWPGHERAHATLRALAGWAWPHYDTGPVSPSGRTAN